MFVKFKIFNLLIISFSTKTNRGISYNGRYIRVKHNLFTKFDYEISFYEECRIKEWVENEIIYFLFFLKELSKYVLNLILDWDQEECNLSIINNN